MIQRSRILMYLWLIGTGVVIASMYQGLSVYGEAEQRLERQREENQRLGQSNAELTERIQIEKSDVSQERRARNELGLQRAGETIVTLVPETQPVVIEDSQVLGEQSEDSEAVGPVGSVSRLIGSFLSSILEHFSR